MRAIRQYYRVKKTLFLNELQYFTLKSDKLYWTSANMPLVVS